MYSAREDWRPQSKEKREHRRPQRNGGTEGRLESSTDGGREREREGGRKGRKETGPETPRDKREREMGMDGVAYAGGFAYEVWEA